MSNDHPKEPYQSKGRDNLKQLAKDIVYGLVFHSGCVQDETLVPSIFMPLALINKEDLNWMVENKISFFYEYLDKAGPTSINGYPIFLSMRYLDTQDHKTLHEIVSAMHAKMQEVLDDT